MRIGIMGSGSAGLCVAIRLRRAGFAGFTVFGRDTEGHAQHRELNHAGDHRRRCLGGVLGTGRSRSAEERNAERLREAGSGKPSRCARNIA